MRELDGCPQRMMICLLTGSPSIHSTVVCRHCSGCSTTYFADIDFFNMTKTMKKVAVEVVTGGGIVRGIHNHGFRDLAHRFKAKFADKEGKRYYETGRFISIYYDANPATMRGVEQILKLDEEILRNTHLRARSVLDICNTSREHKNPFIQRAHELGLLVEPPPASSSSMPPPPPARPDGK